MAKIERFRLQHLGRSIQCRIHRGKRLKTMALKVSTEGMVTVYVPGEIKTSKARHFAQSRVAWITSKKDYFSEMGRIFPRKEFISGESFSINGKTYRLRFVLVVKTNPTCHLQRRRLVVRASGPQGAREAIISFFVTQTQSKVQSILGKLIPAFGIEYPKIKIVDQENRWASCSKNQTLRFNWKLGMVPPFVLNYVTAHELCHLKHPNHSEGFWRTLKALNPRAESARNWLRKNSGILRTI